MTNPQGSNDIAILKDERVSALLVERHILDQDVKDVIGHAEAAGEKLYEPGSERYLGKLKTPNATFYVEYSRTDKGYEVHTAYFHKSEIVKE